MINKLHSIDSEKLGIEEGRRKTWISLGGEYGINIVGGQRVKGIGNMSIM